MPAPTPDGDLDEDAAVVAAAGALPVLGQGAEVGVVLDVHGDAEHVLGGGAGVDALPAGEDRGGADDVVRRPAPAARGRPAAAGRGRRAAGAAIEAASVERLARGRAGRRCGAAPRRGPARSGRRPRPPRGCGRSRRRPPVPAAGRAGPRTPPAAAGLGLDQARGRASSRTMLDTVAGRQPGQPGQLGLGEAPRPPARSRSTSSTRLLVGRPQRRRRPGRARRTGRRGHGATVQPDDRIGQELTTYLLTRNAISTFCRSTLDGKQCDGRHSFDTHRAVCSAAARAGGEPP